MSLIRLENITKRYDNHQVLREVYLQLSRGDRLGLIGSNGSGKTTVLKLILKQEEPDQGTVAVDEGLRIGYFSQFSELAGSACVLEVLEELFEEIHRIKADLAGIEQAMERRRDDTELDRLVEIENYRFQEYRGDYTHYIREKRIKSKSLARQFEHEEELLVFESESIANRIEARKHPSKALIRKVADIRKREVPRLVDRIVTDVYDGIHVSDTLLNVTHLKKGFDDQLLFEDLSFNLMRGDRLAIIGPNGCGKSTLIKCLVDDRTADAGEISWVKGAKFAFFNRIEDELDPKDSVSHAVNVFGLAYKAARKSVNRFLSLLRFSDTDLNQRIGTLSGGQRARVALAKCLLSGAGVMVLDEPTNHLDITSAQVIERALIHFPGAVIFVSHDRFFIDSVASRMLIFAGNGRVDEINGNWTIWQGLQSALGDG